MWTDSHCHLGYDGVSAEAVTEAAAQGVTRMVTVGTDAAASRAAVDWARRQPGVFATVGLHPHEAKHGVATLDALLDPVDPVVVGIGECGLDYFYEHSPRGEQRDAFVAQIASAAELDLALVVHTRDAWDDTFDILEHETLPGRWVLHCFTGGPVEARRALDLGAYLSFSGIVTFKNAADVRQAAALCPADRILVETDSPYLAPVPKRGQPNQPAWVPFVGAVLAEVRGVAVDTVAATTWDNATAAFRLPA